ncbi:MAG: ankyrin repeat domain-containing protein [Alphaproteobacteria bacterium]
MIRYYKKSIIIFIALLFCLNIKFCNIVFANEGFSYNNDLVQAVNNNNIDETINLIKNGAAIDARGKFGITPLMRAAFNGNEKIIKLLLELGADAEAVDIGGATALHIATRMGHKNLVEILINQNIDIDIEDNDGWTPLMRAASLKSPQIAKLLLNAKADPLKLNKWGQSATSQAILNNNTNIVEIFSKNKVFESINAEEKQKLLSFAKLKNNDKVMSILENSFNKNNNTYNETEVSSGERPETNTASQAVISKVSNVNNNLNAKIHNAEHKDNKNKELENIAKEDLAIITNGDFIAQDESLSKNIAVNRQHSEQEDTMTLSKDSNNKQSKFEISVTDNMESNPSEPSLPILKAEAHISNNGAKEIDNTPWLNTDDNTIENRDSNLNKGNDQTINIIANNKAPIENAPTEVESEKVNIKEPYIPEEGEGNRSYAASVKVLQSKNAIPNEQIISEANNAKLMLLNNSPYWIETPYYNRIEANSKFEEIAKLIRGKNYRVKIVKPINNSKISAIQIGPISNQSEGQKICQDLISSEISCKIVKNLDKARYK